MLFGPMGHKVKNCAGDKQGHREMDQHDVLRVLGGKRGFEVEGIQHWFALAARLAGLLLAKNILVSLMKTLPVVIER